MPPRPRQRRFEVGKLATNVQYVLNESMNEDGVGYKIFRMNEIVRGQLVDNGSIQCPDIGAEEFSRCSILNSRIFHKAKVSLAAKSGATNNIDGTKMKNIKVPVSSVIVQKSSNAKLDELENQIGNAQALIDSAAGRKQAILQQHIRRTG